jgi:DNA-binding IclR family transcriptional regulator
MESQQVAGVTNLSVPIFGPLGTVIAALTSPFTDRLDKGDAPDQAAVLKLLIAAGKEISQRSLNTD